MSEMLFAKTILAENLRMLKTRWLLAQERDEKDMPRSLTDSTVEKGLAETLARLDVHALERASQTRFPLFQLDFAIDSMLSLQGAIEFTRTPNDERITQMIIELNEIMLFNRWRAASEDGMVAMICYGLNRNDIESLRSSSYEQIKSMTQTRASLASFAVDERYVYLAGRGINLGSRQRDALCLTQN